MLVVHALSVSAQHPKGGPLCAANSRQSIPEDSKAFAEPVCGSTKLVARPVEFQNGEGHGFTSFCG